MANLRIKSYPLDMTVDHVMIDLPAYSKVLSAGYNCASETVVWCAVDEKWEDTPAPVKFSFIQEGNPYGGGTEVGEFISIVKGVAVFCGGPSIPPPSQITLRRTKLERT